MKQIESMSSDQWGKIPEIRQELIDLECKPIDEEKARYWIKELYDSIGEANPKVLFFDSPIKMHLAFYSIKSQLGGQLRDQLRDQLWDQLRDQLRDQLWDQLRGQLRDQLWDQLWDQLGDQLRGQLRDQLDTQWMSAYLGWFKGGKLAGMKFSQQSFRLYSGYLENVSSILPFRKIVFASRRPIEIHWQNNVLHNENGPAVLYADGWAIYSIEGIRVDEQIVNNPLTQTLSQLNNEDNEEKKRIRISRYGWHKYLEEMEASVVDISMPVHWMESLMQCGDMKILCTYDPSTGRPYVIEVDPSCQTCEEAQRYLLAPEIALQGLGIDPSKVKTYPILRT